MLLAEEIAEEYEVEGVEVQTPNGWRPITRVYKTIPMAVYELELEDDYALRGSGHHLVKTESGWKAIEDLIPGEDRVYVGEECELKTVVSVLETGEEEPLYDITVDDPSGEFFSNGILSHNSTTMCCRQQVSAHVFPRLSGLYIAPSFPMLETYASRFQEMEGYCRVAIGKQNKYSKRYANGSKIDMAYALESARDVRGKSVDTILIDECVSYDSILFCHVDNLSVDIPTRICDIHVGDRVMAADKNNNIVYDRVTAKKYNGVRKCYALRTESGKLLRATGNHKINTGEGWLYVSDIRRRVRGSQAVQGGYRGLHTGPTDRLLNREPGDACNGAGHTSRGRVHTEPSGELVQETAVYKTVPSAEGLRRGEGICTSRDACEHIYTGEQRFQEGGFLRGDCDDTLFYSGGAVLVSMLQQARGEGRRDSGDEEVCVSCVGGSTDVGGCSVVGSGRRKPVVELPYAVDELVQRRGGGQTDCMDQEEWCEARRSSGVVYKSVDRDSRTCYTVLHSSNTYRGCEDSTLCTRVDAVQDSSGREVRDVRMRALRSGVQDNNATGEEHGVPWSLLLPGVLERGGEGAQAEIQGEDGSGCDARAVAAGVCEQEGQGAGVQEEVLRGEQGECVREGTGETPGSECGGCYNGDGSCVLDLREEIQDGHEDVLAAETLQLVCVPGSDVSEKEDSVAVCTVACKAEGSERLIFEKVVSVEYCGELPVYDITTETTNSFIVNDIHAHNCQNLNPDILPEIIFTQSLSKLPMTVYAGTALSTDTVLEDKWQLSSMGMWHVRAKDGKHWLNMYDRETLYKVCNNPLGPTCPYTGKILDVTNGCYVHANKKSLDNGDVGLHVPQCIIKDIAEDPVQWGKVYKHIQEDDFKKVLQECFGIAVAEGSREITVTDLQNAAVLNLTEEEIKERCRTGFYRPIISGCDWGGSDYNPAAKTKKSYTVHCIIGLAPDGMVDILHYRRHSGMDYTAITGLIMRDHHEFNAKAIASDFGAGAAYNNEIRRYVPIGKHFVMDYVGPASAAMATPKGDHMPNQIALNRTEALTNVFKDLKRGLIRARSWDASGQYLLDWLNMFRVPTETASGKRTFLYRRNPQKSDDALHAFNFAYALMKFYKGESLVEDPAVTRAVNAVLRAVTPLQKQAVARLQQQLSSDIQWVTSID